MHGLSHSITFNRILAIDLQDATTRFGSYGGIALGRAGRICSLSQSNRR